LAPRKAAARLATEQRRVATVAAMNAGTAVTVEVWVWSLDVAGPELERLTAILSPQERARADRYFKPIDRDRWIVSRGRTRELLAENVGGAAAEISFQEEPNGRPFLAGRTPHFNISHSQGLGALAISYDAPVGVDVEAIRLIEEADIAWALSPAERERLAQEGPAEQLEAFFRFWTLKEAFMKGTGLGVALPLHDFDMALDEPALTRLAGQLDAPSQWRFSEHVPMLGMRAAVCSKTGGRDMVVTWRRVGGDQ